MRSKSNSMLLRTRMRVHCAFDRFEHQSGTQKCDASVQSGSGGIGRFAFLRFAAQVPRTEPCTGGV